MISAGLSLLNRDPRYTKSRLGQAYWRYHSRVMAETQPKIMGHVTTAVLEGIETFATDNPNSDVARVRGELLQAMGSGIPAGDPGAVARFSDLSSKRCRADTLTDNECGEKDIETVELAFTFFALVK